MPYEIDFLQPGDSNGDAICMRYWSADENRYIIHVIDGGYSSTGEAIVDHVKRYYGNPSTIDHVTLTHAHDDHVGGLSEVFANFKVRDLTMNRPWLYAEQTHKDFHQNFSLTGLRNSIMDGHEALVELQDLAFSQGTRIWDVFQGTPIGAVHVLWPSKSAYIARLADQDRTPQSYADSSLRAFVEGAKRAIRRSESWYQELLSENEVDTSASNESSVIQLMYIDDELVVLTADANPAALHAARDYYEAQNWRHVTPKIFQVPHHGSLHNSTPSSLNRWLGRPRGLFDGVNGFAICSIGKNQWKYPRSRVSNAFIRRGFPVYHTREGGIQYFSAGMPARQGWGAPNHAGFADSYEE
jgi:beta-lactamase superfamily II metal-dependent hydrolase